MDLHQAATRSQPSQWKALCYWLEVNLVISFDELGYLFVLFYCYWFPGKRGALEKAVSRHLLLTNLEQSKGLD
jgi:hypothetical protein